MLNHKRNMQRQHIAHGSSKTNEWKKATAVFYQKLKPSRIKSLPSS